MSDEKELVIKDFNVPAVNGRMYNMEAPCTQLAIIKFVEKRQVFGELNHPKLKHEPIALTDPDTNSEETNNFLTRMTEIDLSNVAVHITDIRYDEDKKQIIGKVKSVPNVYEKLFEHLEQNKVAFGMRSLCHRYKKSDNDTVFLDVVDIITFDIINTDKPENT